MRQTTNASLKHLNSFSVEASASRLVILETRQDLQEFADKQKFDPNHDLILGGGSNILFAGNVDGTVVLNNVKGKRIIADVGEEVLVEACAGENWHQLVLWTLSHGLCGLENLSLIPGLSGAAPMQNIGAYGVELADILDMVEALDLQTGEFCEFSNADCQFSYRDSRFKSVDAGRYLISRIRLRLGQHFTPNLSYGGLREELDSMGVTSPSAREVSDAVIRIRQRKLPDPATLGNAGSFFKNPVVSRARADQIKKEFSGLPVYPLGSTESKLSAAWLIEHSGWKGKSMGGAAVSEQHALVLVNKKNASGQEILALADAIKESIRERFGINLQVEPRIVNPST